MNISDHNKPGSIAPATAGGGERDFDAQARQLHAVALTALGPATRARLRAARQSAAAHPGAATGRRHGGWWLASAFSAVLAIGLGVHLYRPAPVATPALASGTESEELFEQNPDLYVWLASDGALAMEQTR